ncbi:uncharacterized protein UV8b_00140 [Ustilaginoidea virens]|uniref:SNF7 family protein n=1 Tax=Ustilaginoidea virens TaxID=1159556 RepID=A0A8E5HJ61_USTVR|nr:uncharacterized protein UV8b_00140 [Ustilaginoidea virens]QUC15899.1 hypothetical protein UV8b_00140 [Ustilaginoidea virens]
MADLAVYLAEHDPNFRRARLPALYADFRPQKTVNPDGYDANVIAWQGALSLLSLNGLLSGHGSESSILILSVDASLRRVLESKEFGQPLALGDVIRQATSRRELVPVGHFSDSASKTHSSKISSLTWGAAEWALKQLGIASGASSEDNLPSGRYVIMRNIELARQALERHVADRITRFDRVFTTVHFKSIFAPQLVPGQRLSDQDIDVLLTYLARDKHLIDYNGVVVRIRNASDNSAISDDDVAVASIKELMSNLRHQADVLTKRVEDLHREAKDALERKNRITAMAVIKSRRLAENCLAKRYTVLHQLEDVAARIEQASDHVEFLKVIKSSALALRNLNTQIGNPDHVHEVMDHIREQMSETDEVGAILAESVGEPIDDSEIDKELAALGNEARGNAQADFAAEQEEQEAKNVHQLHSESGKLPTPPSEIPASRELSVTPSIEAVVAELSLGHS